MRLIAIAALVLAPASPTLAAKPCVNTEPAEVVLDGVIVLRDELGPPSFGDTPNVDQPLKVRVLRTDVAFAVCDEDGKAGMWLRDVQLVGGGGGGGVVGARARLRGRLFWPENAFHFAPMMMIVTEVLPAI